MAILSAPVTGILAQMMVSVGDQVAEGDEVAIIESMKMEIPVYANTAGQVIAIEAQIGAVIEEGGAIAKLEAK